MKEIMEFKAKLKAAGFEPDKKGSISLRFEPQAKVAKEVTKRTEKQFKNSISEHTNHLSWREPRWFGKLNHPMHPLRKPESKPFVCRSRQK